MRFVKLFFTALSICQIMWAQEYFNVNGFVFDSKTNLPLSFANIRIAESTLGTAANKDGHFNLKLYSGRYELIASYIGFISDTIQINLNEDINDIVFKLSQTKVSLPEIVVRPGINPAIEIIRKAIDKKLEREKKIFSYVFDAYTKGLIRTSDEITGGRNSVSMGIGSSDSADLKITGILENQSKGFFKKPNNYKEIIYARKQSANFPPSINTLTGGRLIQNFYNNDINFIGTDIPGPISENALDYYDYYLEETFGTGESQVFKVYMQTINPSDPGFEGNIYITAQNFDLAKVNLQLNRAANIGGLFDTVNVFQQFSVFSDSISMPVDYRIFVKANYLGLAKFGFELNTILYDYKLNTIIDEDIFDKAIVTVRIDADKRDSTFWSSIQTIPNTDEEEAAYSRIDSLKNIPKNFWDDFSLLSTRFQFNDYLSSSAPITMYHFNPVEGHALDFGFWLEDYLDERLNSNIQFSYGFSDKKFKTDFSMRYLLGDYRTTRLDANLFNRTNILFGESDEYNELSSTILALLSKYSFRDYYYSNGFSLGLSGEVFPVLRLGIEFSNATDQSSVNRSDFSFFAKDKKYHTNKMIDNLRYNTVTASFRFDPRDYVEDGFNRRRVDFSGSYFTLGGSFAYSGKDFLKSETDFRKYDITVRGTLSSFASTRFNYKIYGTYSSGNLPIQLYHAIPGNIDLVSKTFTFRTLGYNDVITDRAVSIYTEYNFRDLIFRYLAIPGIKDWEIQVKVFVNALHSNPSRRNNSNPDFNLTEYLHPFYETGFSIGHILIPLQFEFAWKLNYRDENNFRFGINTFAF